MPLFADRRPDASCQTFRVRRSGHSKTAEGGVPVSGDGWSLRRAQAAAWTGSVRSTRITVAVLRRQCWIMWCG